MKKLLLTFSIFFTLISLAYCEESEKKIGLVLSGGGAKGFAHFSIGSGHEPALNHDKSLHKSDDN